MSEGAVKFGVVVWPAAAIASIALLAQPAAAASAADAGAIVITATPLDETGAPLARIPANAQSLDAGDIRRQDPANLANLLNDNIGAVSVSDGTGNPYQNDVNYRGFQATSLLGAPVGLAVYFDGVRANEPFGSIVNWDLIPMNAARTIDVLPGSNPIFGLNALGGALVVNTKNGKDDPGVVVSGLGGSFGRWAASLEAGGADARTGLDYFLAGNWDKQTGFRQYSASQVQQLYGKLRWRGPGDQTLVELSGAFADTALNGTQSLPLDMLSTPSAAYTWPDFIDNHMRLITLKVSHQFDDADQVSAQAYYRQSNATSGNSNADLDDGCFDDDGAVALTSAGAAKCGGQAPNGTAINSVTGANALALGYGRWTSDINSSMVDSETRQQTFGLSAQWRNTARLMGQRNAFTLGAAFDQSAIDYSQATYLARMIDYQTVIIPNQEYGFTANGLAPSPSNLPTFTGGNVLSAVTLGARVDELNLYASDTFDLTDQFSVTLAGSYAYNALHQSGVNSQYLNDDGGYSWTDDVTGVGYYDPSYVQAYKYANAGSGAAAAPNGVPANSLPGPETANLDGSHAYQRFNPSVGFNYNPMRALNVFGDYSESMRAPTSIELSCADPDHPCALPTGFNGDPNLKAVIARTLELGARGEFGGGFGWNAAIYDSRLQNDIQFIATSTTYGYFFNVGDTDRRGVELGAHAVLGRLRLSADYAYVEATYRSPFTTAAGENVVAGDRIPGIPASAFKLRADYALSDAFGLGASLRAVSDQYAHGNEDNQDPTGKVPGYTVVDVDAHYRIGKALTLSLDIDNLFNQAYSTYGLSGTPSIYTLATQQFRTPAPPFGAWFKVAYAFGGAESRSGAD